jgi:hypothetical protein
MQNIRTRVKLILSFFSLTNPKIIKIKQLFATNNYAYKVWINHLAVLLGFFVGFVMSFMINDVYRKFFF